MATTIYDIAKICHCSTTTVSKVLNGTGKISSEMKNRILMAAKNLGYVRSESARSLASSNKSSKMVGVLLHILEDKSIGHELFSNILNAFRNEMEKHGYDICFLRNIDDKDEIEYRDFLTSRGLDGVFVLSSSVEKKKTVNLLKENIPLVAFDIPDAHYEVNSNNKESVAALVDQLVKLGHRSFAYVRPKNYGVSFERFSGFLLGLERNNIPFDERMIIEAPYYCSTSAKEATDKVLSSSFKPTVIMYPDDYTAINAVQYLHQLGYRVPEDYSITGFDGIEIANVMHPSLMTVKQNTLLIGKNAAKLLLNQINHEEIKEKRIIIPADIIHGASVAKIDK